MAPRRPDESPGAAVGGHIPALDGLRGLAILAVMVYHFVQLTPVTRAADVVFLLAGAGWTGVDLFFVLSGFLITGILFDTKHSPIYWRSFYSRRALRIFPLYFGYLAVMFCVARGLPAGGTTSLRQYEPWCWVYLSNVWLAIHHAVASPFPAEHLWSLSVEEQFYIVWPVIVLWLDRRALMVTCVLAFVAAGVIRCWLLVTHTDPVAIYVLTATRLDGLAVGAFIALAARGPRGIADWARAARYVGAAAALTLAAVVVGVHHFFPYHPVVQAAGYPALALVFGAALVIALTRPISLLGTRLLRSFGRYSYGLYMTHQLVPLALGAVGVTAASLPLPTIARAVSFAVVCGTVAYGAAFGLFHLYERPFLRLKDRMSPARAPSRVAAEPVPTP